MRKLSIAVAVALSAGPAGLVWADDLNPQPLPPGVHSQGDGGKLTAGDKTQITGNLKGGTGAGKSLHKQSSKTYFIKYNKATNTYSKWMKANGKTVPYTVGSATGGAGSGKASLNNSTISGNSKGLAKPEAVDGFSKQNGFDKSSPGNTNLPAVQK